MKNVCTWESTWETWALSTHWIRTFLSSYTAVKFFSQNASSSWQNVYLQTLPVLSKLLSTSLTRRGPRLSLNDTRDRDFNQNWSKFWTIVSASLFVWIPELGRNYQTNSHHFVLNLKTGYCCVQYLPEQATALSNVDTAVLHPLVTRGITRGLWLKIFPGKKVKCGEPANRHLFDFWIIHLLLTQNLWEVGCKERER